MNHNVLYGLRVKSTGKLLGLYISSNGDAEYASPISYIFSEDDELLFLAKTPQMAEAARTFSADWFNSSKHHPTWENPQNLCGDIKPRDVEVVSVRLQVEPIQTSNQPIS